MKKSNLYSLVVLVCIMFFIGFSCSKSGSSSTYTAPPGGASTVNVTMYNMAFSPLTETVSKGTIIKWVNDDSYAHWVVSNDGASFNSGTIAGGSTYSFTTTDTGTFAYHCQIHGYAMSGTLKVTP